MHRGKPIARTGAAAGILIASALVSRVASAQEEDRPGTHHFGVGLMGAIGGNFLDKPDRTIYDPDVYPGYSGATGGGGLMLDGRFLHGLLGVELDILRTSDKGHGEITINGQTFTHNLGQGAWHVPLLAKLSIPSPLVSPQILLGPEFVFPSDPESKLNPSLGAADPRATADNYVMVTFGLGLEIKVSSPSLDLRIPVGIRGSYNPGVSSTFRDRANLNTVPWQYHSEWKYAVDFTAGAAVYF